MTDRGFTASGYWYDDSDESRTDVLNALRRYRQAERDMRARTRTSMKMGETDLAAIRYLLRQQQQEVPVSPGDLARHLGITSASTAVLITRLVRSGHMEKLRNPDDGRASLLTATVSSNYEVRATMAGMHARMIAIADGLSADDARVVVDFLRAMAAAVDEVD